MSTAAAILPTQNHAWGFWGTLGQPLGAKLTDCAWGIASRHLAEVTGADAEAVRAFLDSKHGRHFADTVLNHWGPGGALTMEQAVERAAAEWKAYPVSKSTRRDYGIPAGLDYLTGFVLLAGIEAEA